MTGVYYLNDKGEREELKTVELTDKEWCVRFRKEISRLISSAEIERVEKHDGQFHIIFDNGAFVSTTGWGTSFENMKVLRGVEANGQAPEEMTDDVMAG